MTDQEKAIEDFMDVTDKMMRILKNLQRLAEEGVAMLKPFSDPSFRQIIKQELVNENLEAVRSFQAIKDVVSVHTSLN